MFRNLAILFSAILMSSCWMSGNADLIPQASDSNIPDSLYTTKGCLSNNDCQIYAYGRYCSGPGAYILTNKNKTDTSKLTAFMYGITYRADSTLLAASSTVPDSIKALNSYKWDATMCSSNLSIPGSAVCASNQCQYDPSFNTSNTSVIYPHPRFYYITMTTYLDTNKSKSSQIKTTIYDSTNKVIPYSYYFDTTYTNYKTIQLAQVFVGFASSSAKIRVQINSDTNKIYAANFNIDTSSTVDIYMYQDSVTSCSNSLFSLSQLTSGSLCQNIGSKFNFE